MNRAHIRGGSRLCHLTERLGLLNSIARYELSRGIVFSVPLWIPDNRWDAADVREYSIAEVAALSEALHGLPEVTLFDCGADIGILSAKLCAAAPGITRLFAFEPNRAAFPVLLENLGNLPVETHAFCAALGNAEAQGSLVSPEYDASSHARFVVPGPGDIRIMTIDSLGCDDWNVALKIDVEGAELEVLEGARKTIAQAGHAVISFEAHPMVAERTGRNPRECLQFLSGIRDFRFMVTESGTAVSPDEALPDWDRVFNILCVSV